MSAQQEYKELYDKYTAVTSERDKLKSELNKWEDWPKEYDALKEMRIQSNQNSFACKQAYIIALEFELKHSNKERDKWVELEKTRADLLLQTTGNRNIEMLAKDYNTLKAKLAEANEENKRLLEAINNIANLGLQKLPVDKRWGTALAFAVEALHRARLAKDES
jgi:hypothetical protein